MRRVDVTEETDRHVEPEDPVPGQPLHDGAARRGAGFAAAVASARLLPENHGPARWLDLPALLPGGRRTLAE
jgi:hypothetical protein